MSTDSDYLSFSDLQTWIQQESLVSKTKATYMKAFRSAVEKEFSLLCKEHLLAGLWVMESRFGGMGGTYDPVFWWRLNTAGRDSLQIVYEVTSGLKIQKMNLKFTHLPEIADQLTDLFPTESGWYINADFSIQNSSPFGEIPSCSLSREATELWHLGNDPEKFSGLLIQTVKPFLTDERVIKLLRS